jgi:hypothetical protein
MNQQKEISDECLLTVTILSNGRKLTIHAKTDILLEHVISELNLRYSTDGTGFFLSDANSYDQQDGTFFEIDPSHKVCEVLNLDLIAIPLSWL